MKLNNKGIDILDTRVLIILFVWVTLSFCFVHLTGDFYCFIGWAREVYNSKTVGLAALAETWEIKGFLSRVFYLNLYSFARIFADDRTLAFQYVFKTLGYVELSIMSLLSAFAMPKTYRIAGSKLKTFLLVNILCFSMHFSCHLQPEFISVFFIVLSISLYLRNNLTSSIMAGVLLGLCFFLKSPIPVLGLSVVFISMAIRDKRTFKEEAKSILPLGVAMICIIVCLLYVFKKYSPQEITDIVDAGYYQASGSLTLSSMLKTCLHSLSGILKNVWFIPAILIVFMGISVVKKREKIIWISALAACFIYIIIAHTLFIYHYSIFLIPTVFIACRLLKDSKVLIVPNSFFLIVIGSVTAIEILMFAKVGFVSNKYVWLSLSLLLILLMNNKRANGYAMVGTGACGLIVYITMSSFISYNTINGNHTYDKFIKDYKSNTSLQAVNNQRSIMYLDAGTGVFICGIQSYLRYIYPLPIQRIDESQSDFVNSDTFIRTKKEILNYDGDFMTIDAEWFFIHPHTDIEYYINQGYNEVCTMPTCVFSWDMYPQNPAIINNTLKLLGKK